MVNDYNMKAKDRLSRKVENILIWGNRLICMPHVAANRSNESACFRTDNCSSSLFLGLWGINFDFIQAIFYTEYEPCNLQLGTYYQCLMTLVYSAYPAAMCIP